MNGKRKKRRNGFVIITVAVMLLCSVILYKEYDLKAEQKALESKQEELNEAIEAEKAIKKELMEKDAYMDTQRYIEDIAREKLGLCYENEIIFKEKDGNKN